MTDTWSERAEAYRRSDAHREGRDLELFAEWAEGQTGLDVATGGGHVARVLRGAGLEVVTIDCADHVPAVGFEALGRIVREPVLDGRLLGIDRNAVVVVYGNELA